MNDHCACDVHNVWGRKHVKQAFDHVIPLSKWPLAALSKRSNTYWFAFRFFFAIGKYREEMTLIHSGLICQARIACRATSDQCQQKYPGWVNWTERGGAQYPLLYKVHCLAYSLFPGKERSEPQLVVVCSFEAASLCSSLELEQKCPVLPSTSLLMHGWERYVHLL